MADAGLSFAALIVICIFSLLGGLAFHFMVKGIHCGKCDLKGCCGTINIPPLLGMLLGGCIAMQAFNPLIVELDPEWSLIIRKLALTIILLRAGLELDLKDLKSKSVAVIMLTALPQFAECCVCGLMITFIYPMQWALGFAAGSMMGAVSPAVVVPACIRLNNQGYGTNKGIAGVVIAAASLDDILAISMFGIFLGIGLGGEGGHNPWGGDPLIGTIITGPFELIAGIILGILIGLLLALPCFHKGVPYKWKAVFLVFMAVGLVFIWNIIHMSGLGYLATITSAAVGATKWGKHEAEEIEGLISYLWLIIQIPLFGLIGAALYFGEVDGADVGIGLVIIIVGLAFRVPSAGAAMCGTPLTFKERCFVAIAWIPKATVQAALGGVLMGAAKDNELGSDFELAGERHLTLAFFSIVITAPIGAILTVWSGEKLLSKGEAPVEQLPESEWGRRAYGHGKGMDTDKLHQVAETLKHGKTSMGGSSADIHRGVSQFESHDVAKAIEDYDREHHHLEHEQENESDSLDSEEVALHRDWSLQHEKPHLSWIDDEEEEPLHHGNVGSLHRSVTHKPSNPNPARRGSEIVGSTAGDPNGKNRD